MKRSFRAFLQKVLALCGYFPTQMTSAHDIRALMQQLKPWSPDKNLIRLGPQGDGGYLVPDDLVGISACFSPGVGCVSGFEKACAERGIPVFLADKLVQAPPITDPLFHFTQIFIGASSNDDYVTLDSWVQSSAPDHTADLLLQMDIEGGEYEVLLSTPDILMRRFRIIVCEFHFLDQLWSTPFFRLASQAFGKILQTHRCIHIHPNNCCGSLRLRGVEIPRVMEFTFLRSDRSASRSLQRTFPHPLDINNTKKPPLVLPPCWYEGDE